MHTTVYHSFDDLPVSYNRLFEEATSQSFLLSLPWFKNLADTTLENGASLRLYGVENGDFNNEPIALLVARCPAGQNGSVLEGKWIGKRTLASFSNHQSSFFSPLIVSTCEAPATALKSLASTICSERPAWSLVDFNLLDIENSRFSGMAEAFRSQGLFASPYFYKSNWFEPIEMTFFDEYIRSRPKPAQKSIRNYKRKLAKLEKAGRSRLELITESSRVEEGISFYNRIYDASWKKRELFPKFAEELMRVCAREGLLRLGLLFIDGEPAGVEFAIVAAGKAIMMKTAYDRRFQKESAGSIAMLHVIRNLIEIDGVTEIDFGTDDDLYKSTWVSQRRERWGILAFNPRTTAGAFSFLRHAGNEQLIKVKRPLKRLLMPLKNTIPRQSRK